MQPAKEQVPSVTPKPSEADYDAFCTTVMASARGRWFLAEYARRHRKADTDAVLAALHRVEDLVRAAPTVSPVSRIRDEVRAVAAMVREAKRELGAGTATISTASKVMALLTLLEERIADILAPGNDRAPLLPPEAATYEDFAPPSESKPEASRARLSVVAQTAEPAPRRAAPSPSSALLPTLDPGEAHPNLLVLPNKAATPTPRATPVATAAAHKIPVAAAVPAATAKQPLPPVDPFADVMALSEEERIALFT